MSFLTVMSASAATTFVAPQDERELGALQDVVRGKVVRSVITPTIANGYAETSYKNGVFTLRADFQHLGTPSGDDFYEGWLVQRDPFKFISTGKLPRKTRGQYFNDFTSSVDYSSYDFYVLTLEPNDGDPAPADHIFEGEVFYLGDSGNFGANADHNIEEVTDDSTFDKAEDATNTSENDTTHSSDTSTDTTNNSDEINNNVANEIFAPVASTPEEIAAEMIKKAVPDLTQSKIDAMLRQITSLRAKVQRSTNITVAKKSSYNKTLDLFERVLQSGNLLK